MKITSKNIFTFSNELFGLLSSAPSLKGNRSDIAVIKETYLNDEWLNKQKFSTGEVSFGNGTFITKDYGKAFKVVLDAYTKCINGNVATIKTFEATLKPFADYVTRNPEGSNPQLVEKAKKLRPPRLIPTPEGKHKSVPKPDKAGVKALAQAYIDSLSDRTNFISVETTMDAMVSDWYGAQSKHRSKSKNDSDADLIARGVSGAIEMLGANTDNLEIQSNQGFDTAKDYLRENIMKIFKATI